MCKGISKPAKKWGKSSASTSSSFSPFNFFFFFQFYLISFFLQFWSIKHPIFFFLVIIYFKNYFCRKNNFNYMYFYTLSCLYLCFVYFFYVYMYVSFFLWSNLFQISFKNFTLFYLPFIYNLLEFFIIYNFVLLFKIYLFLLFNFYKIFLLIFYVS